MRLYLDSSALVKLVQREVESEALRTFLREYRQDERVKRAGVRRGRAECAGRRSAGCCARTASLRASTWLRWIATFSTGRRRWDPFARP